MTLGRRARGQRRVDAIADDHRLTAPGRKALAEITIVRRLPARRQTVLLQRHNRQRRQGRDRHRSGQRIAARSQRLTADENVLSVDLKPDPDGPGTPFQADLTQTQANEAAVNEALNRFGRIDVVVANAGIQHVAPIAEFPVERWQTIVSLLTTSPSLLAKYSWPGLNDTGAGRFVAIASSCTASSPPRSRPPHLGPAAHGVVGLVKTLALEGAGDGITATAVCPGYVRTPLVEKQIADQAKAHNLPEEEVLEKVILQPHAVKQLIEPSEVADVVAFLIGPAGKAFTGVPVTLDQGWTAR
jgi:3-hydroxybutyrate dehydrogenase